MKKDNDICIEVDEFYDFFNDKLTQEESQRISKHVTTCELCQELEQAIRDIKEENPDIDTQKQLQEAARKGVAMLEKTFAKRQKAKTISMLSKSVLVAASIVLIAFFSFFGWNTQNEYFEKDTLLAYSEFKGTTRADVFSNIDDAKEEYLNDDFEKASQIAEKEISSSNKKSNLYLYNYALLVLSYHGDKEYDKALESAKYIITQTDNKTFQKNIKKEMFRLYLEKGEKKLAQNVLNEIKQDFSLDKEEIIKLELLLKK